MCTWKQQPWNSLVTTGNTSTFLIFYFSKDKKVLTFDFLCFHYDVLVCFPTFKGFFKSRSEWILSSLRASATKLVLLTCSTRKGFLARMGSRDSSVNTFCRLAPLTATYVYKQTKLSFLYIFIFMIDKYIYGFKRITKPKNINRISYSSWVRWLHYFIFFLAKNIFSKCL